MLGQVLGLAGRVAGASLHVVTELTSAVASEAVGLAAAAAHPRVATTTDRTGAAVGRAHVAVRGVHLPANQAAARHLEQLVAEHDGVHSVETNGVLGRVAVSYDAEKLHPAALGQLIADAERECGLSHESWAPAQQTHPAHPGAMLRSALGLGLNVAGIGYSTLARALPIPPLGPLPPALSLVDAVPRLRALLEAGLGQPTTDFLLSAAAAVSNSATRQPIALITDACQRYTLYQEAAARRRAWQEWDLGLADQADAHRVEPVSVPPRPVPLPDGRLERTAHRSAMVGLAAAGVTLFTMPGPYTSGVLAATVPKATRAAREGFAAQLDRDASAAGSLVLKPAALRRLDRVDTVLFDADVLLTGRRMIDEVLPIAPDVDDDEVFTRAHDLVDPRRPGRREIDGWSVEPLGEAELPAHPKQWADERAEQGETVLVLRRDGTPVALVPLAVELEPLAEAMVASAGKAGSVRVFGSGDDLRQRLPVDDVIEQGAGLLETVRRLQRDGQVVALVARTGNTELAAADVGIGLAEARGAPPWGAHLICRDPVQVCRLLEAIPLARRTDRHGARLSMVGSALGGVLAMIGPAPGAARRAGIPVNTAALLGLGAGVWAALSAARAPAPVPNQRTAWHAMSSRTVLAALSSSPEGLTESESERRRREKPVERADAELGLGRATMEELATPLTPALAAGAGLSATAGSILDPLLITGVLLVNALIGGAQRLGAQRELRRLTTRSAPRVRVRYTTEHGTEHTTARADELVAGDVVELQAGDAVPADCRLITAHGLEMDESSLTGESATVPKSTAATTSPTVADRTSMLYEGTVVAIGRAVAVVVATGAHTEIGRTQRISAGDEAPVSGVEARLRALTGRVLPFSLGAGVALAVIDLLRGRGFGQTLSRAVGLAVAAVPEGLPFVATVAELAAARRLSARGTLVRNPGTIEALGRVDVLCFDKTGTLTEGRLGLRRVSDGTQDAPVDQLGADLPEVLAAAVRASPFHARRRHVPHQTDRAVLRDAARVGVTADHDQDRVEHLHELAFESGRGYHATLWRSGNGTHVSVKGAPEVVLPLARRWQRNGHASPLDEQARREIGAEVERLALQGYRVLAVAERACPDCSEITDSDVTELEFRGLLALADPIRPTAAQAVATLQAAGVEVMMITGDHPSTAESIAAELNALNGRRVLTGAELDALTDEQLTTTLANVAVFARVTPEQKARIVRQLRAGGRIVAVTGDGANDAPAIRLADVGLALGERATPAAREAADVVITDDRIETITDAIVEGRAMWASVRDALSILLGGNLGEIAYTVGTGLLNGGEALNARQLLLVNMLTDVLPAMAVAVRPPPDVTPEELLAEGPEASLGTALNRDIAIRAAITAIAASIAWLLARPTSSLGQASTTGLVALVSAQLGQTLAVRGRTPLVAVAAAGSLLLLAIIVQTPGVSHIAGSRPLLPHQWAIALTAAAGATAAQLIVPRATQVVISWLPMGKSLLARRSTSPA